MNMILQFSGIMYEECLDGNRWKQTAIQFEVDT